MALGGEQASTVDTAALTVGVLIYAAVSMLEPGRWTWMDSLLALVAAGVLYAFVISHRRWSATTSGERRAIAAVAWIVMVQVSAWPVQNAAEWGVWHSTCTPPDASSYAQQVEYENCNDDAADGGTALALPIAGVAVFFVPRLRQSVLGTPRDRLRSG